MDTSSIARPTGGEHASPATLWLTLRNGNPRRPVQRGARNLSGNEATALGEDERPEDAAAPAALRPGRWLTEASLWR